MSDFLLRSSGGENARKVARRNAQSLTKGFQHTNTVVETGCTGSIKIALINKSAVHYKQ